MEKKKQATEERGSRVKNPIGGGGACENFVGLSMYDVPMENVEKSWVSIWCTLNWIVGFCHKTAEIHFLGIQQINQ